MPRAALRTCEAGTYIYIYIYIYMYGTLGCAVADFLHRTLGCTATMSNIQVRGKVFGKESSVALASGLRAILPMPAVMQIMDVILAGFFNDFLSTVFQEIPGCFVGARPKTQCLDIAHGLQSVIENGLDDFGRSAIAQSDIEKYYDSLPCLKIAAWLVARGANEKHVACLLRHQMCPRVILVLGTLQIAIDDRSVGGFNRKSDCRHAWESAS